MDRAIAETDEADRFVSVREFVPPAHLPALLEQADIFVFASSCENMPNTLLEAMASGLPIACSNRGPMPDILQDGGVYFDPEDDASIAAALRTLAVDPVLRRRLGRRTSDLASAYSWRRCAHETWSFLIHTLELSERPASAAGQTWQSVSS
jgi:glycosyltransferase involved in cell wall biosynthesis